MMAMTDEELKLQMEILTSKTESNPNMVYKANAALNKALNPAFFSGNGTKIVNAINDLATKADQAIVTSQTVAEKVNSILMDVDTTDNAVIWEAVKELMGKNTIIEGLQEILSGNKVDKILGVDESDKGKLLSVDVDEDGNVILKAIDAILNGGTPNVSEIKYVNSKVPSVQNVKGALDYLFNNMGSGNSGELGGGVFVGEITWDMIEDKPEVIPDNIRLADNMLQLREGSEVVSAVQLMTSKEVDDLLESMN